MADYRGEIASGAERSGQHAKKGRLAFIRTLAVAALATGAVGSFGLRILQLGIQLATAILMAKLMGPGDYGVYSYVFAVVTLLAAPLNIGLPTLILRFTAVYHATGAWGALRGLWRRTFQFVLLAYVGGVAVTLGAQALFGSSGNALFVTFLVATGLLAAMTLTELAGSALRGLQHVLRGQVPDMLVRPLVLLLLVAGGALFVSGESLTPQVAMGLHAAAGAVALLVAVLLLRRYSPAQVRAANAVYAERTWGASLLPLSLLAYFGLLNNQVDIVILGLLRPPEEVGVYRVAVQGASFVGFGLATMNMVLAPRISRMHAEGDRVGLQEMITLSTRTVLLATVPIALGLVLFGHPLLHALFGVEFTDAYPALVILCIGQLVTGAIGSVGIILNMTGHEKEFLFGTMLAAFVNILLNLLWIPGHGLIGAACATATSLVIWNGFLSLRVRRRTGLETTIWGSGKMRASQG